MQITNKFGYIRVSSKDQNEDRQVRALMNLNIPKRNIYFDVQSGKDFNRPEYLKLIKKLKRDDVLFIKSIDRLGRNYTEIIEEWRLITKVKKADIVVIDIPILDTRKEKDLLGTFISDVFLQVLSFVSENERINIKQRQREGIIAAKERGVKFGRPSTPLTKEFLNAYYLWEEGTISATEGARISKLALSTFLYKAKKLHFLNKCTYL